MGACWGLQAALAWARGPQGEGGEVTKRLRFLLWSPAQKRGSLEGGSGLLESEVV